jgi:hypothetical protein
MEDIDLNELCSAVNMYDKAKEHLVSCKNEETRRILNAGINQLQPLMDLLMEIKNDSSSCHQVA